MLQIWKECQGEEHIKPLAVTAWRIVENQNQTATRKLVDSLKEQEILEDLIESYKPAWLNSCKGYHYLLATPFRYPPLSYGSRFGNRYEPSLWYGSRTIEGAMAEKAFYRFHLLKASQADYDELPIKYSVFQTEIQTNKGIDLTHSPFNHYASHISDPCSYIASQELGNQMRKAKIEGFLYESARCPQKTKNIALFVPTGFKHKEPVQPFQTWQGTVTHHKSQIEFVKTNGLQKECKQFSIDLFLIKNTFPTLVAT